jgi:hypothetical protein
MRVFKRIFIKTEEFRSRFFNRNTRAYPIHRLIKKTFTSRKRRVTIVLFGNNVVLAGPEVRIRKMKKNISITVHDTAMERIILILYCLITEKPPPMDLGNFMHLVKYSYNSSVYVDLSAGSFA